jgi:hypothetical protein
MAAFKRREPPSTPSPASAPTSGSPKPKSTRSASAGRGGSRATKPSPAATETAVLEQWLAPSTSSAIDQVEVGLIDDGWEPERVGQAPLSATLAAIEAVGVVEPVLLRPRVGGRFEIITGHRTVAAARSAGMDRVPSVVKDLDDVGALMALVFDGSASGQVTAAGAAELRERLRAAGAVEDDIEDVLAAVPVAEELVAAATNGEAAAAPEAELVPVAEPITEVQGEPAPAQPEPAHEAANLEATGTNGDSSPTATPEQELVPVAAHEAATLEATGTDGDSSPTATPKQELVPVAAHEAANLEATGTDGDSSPTATPEQELVPVAAHEAVNLEATGTDGDSSPTATPEQELVPVVAVDIPAPEAEPPLVPVVAVDIPAPEAEPPLVPVATHETADVDATGAKGLLVPEGASSAWAGRWLPMPAGRPRLARLSSAFADAPKMLGILATDRFTGTAELVGRDGRKDTIAFLDGRILATYVEQGQRQVDTPLRLPSPDRGPTVEITVRPHPRAVSVALALALRSPARFTGLHAAFLHLDGLLDLLRRERADAACVVTSSTGTGVILLDAGQPIAAYARRWADEPSEEAETTDVSAVLDMLVSGDGAVDVHTGDVPEPLDLDDVISRAVPGD